MLALLILIPVVVAFLASGSARTPPRSRHTHDHVTTQWYDGKQFLYVRRCTRCAHVDILVT